jgi:hypothetical protein
MNGLGSITQASLKMHKLTLPVALLSLILISQESLPSPGADLHIYKEGTGFVLNIRWLGLSAVGTMDIMGNAENAILVRSQVTELGGLLGFLARFLRMYKKSNIFDSYIDSVEFTTVRYEIYRLKKDGSKETAEHIYFDREQKRIVSLKNNKTIVKNVPPDIQDAFSAFLELICRFNDEELFPGKVFEVNLYGYEKFFKVKVEVIHQALRDGKTVYTLEIADLPEVFKYPASITFEVTDIGNGFQFPTRGECTIKIRLFPDITLRGELREKDGSLSKTLSN